MDIRPISPRRQDHCVGTNGGYPPTMRYMSPVDVCRAVLRRAQRSRSCAWSRSGGRPAGSGRYAGGGAVHSSHPAFIRQMGGNRFPCRSPGGVVIFPAGDVMVDTRRARYIRPRMPYACLRDHRRPSAWDSCRQMYMPPGSQAGESAQASLTRPPSGRAQKPRSHRACGPRRAPGARPASHREWPQVSCSSMISAQTVVSGEIVNIGLSQAFLKGVR